MKRSEAVGARKRIGKSWWILVAVLAQVVPAHGQHFDITPLVGFRTGGSVDVQQEGQTPQVRAHVGDSATFGVAAGIRFFDELGCDDCSVVEFRWMRQNTNLALNEAAPVATPFGTAFGRTDVTLDHYLGDFTWEAKLEEAKSVRPFILASVGAARLLTPAGGSTRFVFGLGGGVKVFPQRHWGVRLGVEYLPMVMSSGTQRVVCAASCVVALGGGLLNQFEFTVGPVFRF